MSAREIREDRARAQELDRRATEKAHEYALWLTTYGVPVRDIATLLDVSPQRFSQLANTQHRPEKG
ncbi:hypothetical protein JDV09_09790 [Mycobacterium sp. Y57]|uniref:hypothetical protein n=1 Tax=Mycolicibacterium xanthum TaxID=2796469 RepID=UPI001C86397E|nr:hypothetical protein [Mycolicibacterium xanthum]MBX7432394.1 hypothetical protein [Mycolicibacterium xanthum]